MRTPLPHTTSRGAGTPFDRAYPVIAEACIMCPITPEAKNKTANRTRPMSTTTSIIHPPPARGGSSVHADVYAWVPANCAELSGRGQCYCGSRPGLLSCTRE